MKTLCALLLLAGLTFAQSSGFGGNGTQLFIANPQTSTYQVVTNDFEYCKAITVASGTFTITLVAAANQPASGRCIEITNYGSGTLTVAPSGQNINGSGSSLTIAAGSASAPIGLWIKSDGTNYFAQTLGGSSGTGGLPIPSGTQTAGDAPVATSPTATAWTLVIPCSGSTCTAPPGYSITTSGSGSGSYVMSGSTSGSAAIGVPAVAGTPSVMLLPTADPSAATYYLGSAAPSGGNMQTSWIQLPVQNAVYCGTTTACSATAKAGTHAVFGSAPLVSASPSTAAITGVSPAFTSASTYSCTVNDQTTRTNQVSVLVAGYVSGSAFTITGPNTVTDIVNFVCVGY